MFDFDGVIVNSFDLNYSTNKKLYPSITEEDFKKVFEGNIFDIEKQYEQKGHVDWDKEHAPKLVAHLIEEKMAQAVIDVSKIAHCVVVSSTIEEAIKSNLKKNSLDTYFDHVYGWESGRDKTVKIQKVFRSYNASPGDAVFITDTLGDIREARKAGVESIAVTWGFHERERLEKGEPFVIVDRPEQIIAEINRYFN